MKNNSKKNLFHSFGGEGAVKRYLFGLTFSILSLAGLSSCGKHAVAGEPSVGSNTAPGAESNVAPKSGDKSVKGYNDSGWKNGVGQWTNWKNWTNR